MSADLTRLGYHATHPPERERAGLIFERSNATASPIHMSICSSPARPTTPTIMTMPEMDVCIAPIPFCNHLISQSTNGEKRDSDEASKLEGRGGAADSP